MTETSKDIIDRMVREANDDPALTVVHDFDDHDELLRQTVRRADFYYHWLKRNNITVDFTGPKKEVA